MGLPTGVWIVCRDGAELCKEAFMKFCTLWDSQKCTDVGHIECSETHAIRIRGVEC